MANELMQTLTNNLDASLVAVQDALPKDLNKARFLQNTIAVIKSNPNLTTIIINNDSTNVPDEYNHWGAENATVIWNDTPIEDN